MPAFIFRMIFLAGASLDRAVRHPKARTCATAASFTLLMLVSTLGMDLMASAADLIMLYLAIETTSIPLYVLAGFFTHDQKSVEVGLEIPAVRRDDLGGHAVWLQPAVRVYRHHQHLCDSAKR